MGRWKRFGLISVQFVNDNVLEDRLYTFDRRPLVLLPWKPRLRIDFESIQKLLWIQLPGLPWEF